MKLKRLPIIICSLALLTPISILFLNTKDVVEADAYENGVWLAIDGKNEIGYIASERKDFFKDYFHIEVNLDNTRETNIFNTFVTADAYIDYIKTVVVVDKITIDYPAYFFAELPNLEEIRNISNLDTSNAHNFTQMFSGSTKLKTVDFTNFNTSNAWEFHEMFKDTGFQNLDLSSFNTKNVSDFSYMFLGCTNLETVNVSSFDTTNAFEMDRMFSSCPNLKCLDISSFDLSGEPRVEDMFYGTKLEVFHAPKVVSDSTMDTNILKFYLPQMSMDIPYFYDSKLNNFTSAKPSNSSIKYYSEDIKNEVVAFAEQFELIVSNVFEDGVCSDVESLRNRWEGLADCIDEWTYEYKDSFLDILKSVDNSTPISNVAEPMEFYDFVYNNYYGALMSKGGDFLDRCPNAEDKDGYLHIGVDTANSIGYLASFDTYEILSSDVRWKIKIGEDSYQNSVFSSKSYMDYEDIQEVIVQDEIVVIDASCFFKGLTSVTSITGIENLDTSLSLSFCSMFEDCISLETLDTSGLSAVKVNVASKMFKNCKNLYELKLPNSPTYEFTQIDEMFYDCSSLVTIDLSRLDFSRVNFAFDCLNGTNFCYLLTPKKMPTSITCSINLYAPLHEQNYGFYDISFNTYTSIPKDKSSFLIISEAAKRLIGKYCDDFKKDCEYYCDEDGSTSEESLTKLWSNQSKNFNDHFIDTPHSYLLDFFKQDNSSCTYDELKKFSERYDYIYGKYHTKLDKCGGDFALRSSLINLLTNNSTNLLFSDLNKSNEIILIVILLLAASCLSAFYVYRRKNRQ